MRVRVQRLLKGSKINSLIRADGVHVGAVTPADGYLLELGTAFGAFFVPDELFPRDPGQAVEFDSYEIVQPPKKG